MAITFLLLIIASAATAAPTITPEYIVSCCNTSTCTLDLRVSPGAVVNWTQGDTGKAPACLATKHCIITNEGLTFSADYGKDGLFIASIEEGSYKGTEHYFLIYLSELCSNSRLPIKETEVGVPITKPIEHMNLTKVTQNASVFEPVLLSLPPESTNDIRNVRWYKIESEFQLRKTSKIKPGSIENVDANCAVGVNGGDLWVRHVSHYTYGMWLAVVQHTGGRFEFILFNVTVSDWEQNILDIFTSSKADDSDPISISNRLRWTLYGKQRGGFFRVLCEVSSNFPDCLNSVENEGQYILLGERKDSKKTSVLAFYPGMPFEFEEEEEGEEPLLPMHHVAAPEPLTIQTMPPYIPLTFLVVGILATLLILLVMCCYLSRRMHPTMYFAPHTSV